MSYAAVIFDLDGTLYDKKGLARRLALAQLRRFRLRFLSRERKARRALKGRSFSSSEAFYQALFSAIGPEKKARDWYWDSYMQDMVRILGTHYSLRSWVLPLIEKLREEGSRIVIYSDYGRVREKVDALGLPLRKGDLLLGAPTLGGLKPCRESMERLLEILGCPAGECLMIGDREDTDGASARAVGMPFRHIKDIEDA